MTTTIAPTTIWAKPQQTPHERFDGVDDATRYRITVGAFLDLFPEAGPPPALEAHP